MQVEPFDRQAGTGGQQKLASAQTRPAEHIWFEQQLCAMPPQLPVLQVALLQNVPAGHCVVQFPQ